MLLSMTGFGTARSESKGYSIHSEIKSVNNRFLKTMTRLPDAYTFLEPFVDEIVRQNVDRGTITVTIKIESRLGQEGGRLNDAALRNYMSQAFAFLDSLPGEEQARISPLALGDFFRLPGVVLEGDSTEEEQREELRLLAGKNLKEAFAGLAEMREREGKAMATGLAENIGQLRALLLKLREQAPLVVTRYRDNLTEMVGRVMRERNLPLTDSDLVREVALFTDRADVSEEMNRFQSHLDQFDAAMELSEACGKRLDFLTQEMFREVNTTGSKANSHEITAIVVEMKTVIERIREMVQNVE